MPRHVRHGQSHKRNALFFPVVNLSPTRKKASVMSQAGFNLFPLSQHQATVSYSDILNTLTISRDRVSLGSSDSVTALSGHLGSGSPISPDNSLLSSAPISLFTNTPLSISSSLSPGSPQTYAYTQLVRQYQQSQEELKKVNQEYGHLKYVSPSCTNISYTSNAFIEEHMRS